MIEKLIDKKILILGLGREGESTYRLLRRLWPEKNLALADRNQLHDLNDFWSKVSQSDKKAEFLLGPEYLKAINDYQVVIRSPGISLYQIKEIGTVSPETLITSQTEIFLEKARCQTIGITGTKGKSTTANLIHHLLQPKKKVFLVGNMGQPSLDDWPMTDQPENLFVYEMSSHQLDGLRISPHQAVFLNLMPDHLDYFPGLDSYYQAKGNLALHQEADDLLIYNQLDPNVTKAAALSKAVKKPYSQSAKADSICFWKSGQLIYRSAEDGQTEAILTWKEVAGLHPAIRLNMIPAIILAKIYQLSNQQIKQRLVTFKPPAHRLELVGQWHDISFYNDSAATIPAATISALRSIGETVDTLIVGGSEKGSDFRELAQEILKTGVSNLIAFPVTGKQIINLVKEEAELNKKPLPQIREVTSMKEAIEQAFQLTTSRKACLLSPASASFSNFKNYQVRGDAFREWAQKIGQRYDQNSS